MQAVEEGTQLPWSGRPFGGQMPFVRGTERIPIIGDSLMLCHAKDCAYPLGPVIWVKDGVQIFSHLNGGYLVGYFGN